MNWYLRMFKGYRKCAECEAVKNPKKVRYKNREGKWICDSCYNKRFRPRKVKDHVHLEEATEKGS